MIREALKKIRPGAEYTLYGGTYAGLVWSDATQSKPTEAELNAAVADVLQSQQFSAIEQAFDKHIDDVAAARGYGRIGLSPSAACLGYAAYPNQWQSESAKYGQWVANCCALLIQGQQDVIAGTRAMPTPAEAIAELPPMVW